MDSKRIGSTFYRPRPVASNTGRFCCNPQHSRRGISDVADRVGTNRTQLHEWYICLHTCRYNPRGSAEACNEEWLRRKAVIAIFRLFQRRNDWRSEGNGGHWECEEDAQIGQMVLASSHGKEDLSQYERV